MSIRPGNSRSPGNFMEVFHVLEYILEYGILIFLYWKVLKFGVYIVFLSKLVTAWKVSVFGDVLVRINSDCGKIRTRKTPSLFTQCVSYLFVSYFLFNIFLSLRLAGNYISCPLVKDSFNLSNLIIGPNLI